MTWELKGTVHPKLTLQPFSLCLWSHGDVFQTTWLLWSFTEVIPPTGFMHVYIFASHYLIKCHSFDVWRMRPLWNKNVTAINLDKTSLAASCVDVSGREKSLNATQPALLQAVLYTRQLSRISCAAFSPILAHSRARDSWLVGCSEYFGWKRSVNVAVFRPFGLPYLAGQRRHRQLRDRDSACVKLRNSYVD